MPGLRGNCINIRIKQILSGLLDIILWQPNLNKDISAYIALPSRRGSSCEEALKRAVLGSHRQQTSGWADLRADGCVCVEVIYQASVSLDGMKITAQNDIVLSSSASGRFFFLTWIFAQLWYALQSVFSSASFVFTKLLRNVKKMTSVAYGIKGHKSNHLF